MTINLWNLINDENDMPKLNIINSIDYDPNGPDILRPYETIPILCKLSKMHKAHAENIYMATYNHYNELIGFFHIATGHMDKVSASDRIKATCILLSGAYSFEIFHNHPIDDQTPSESDKNSIYMERALAAFLETEYIADYVVTKGGWTCVNDGEEYRFTKDELDFINK